VPTLFVGPHSTIRLRNEGVNFSLIQFNTTRAAVDKKNKQEANQHNDHYYVPFDNNIMFP